MSVPPSLRKMRPWYFVAAMSLMWVVGVFGAMSGCQELDYLRGSHEVTDKLRQDVEEARNPYVRNELVRQQARMTALAKHYRRAFPLAAGRMLLAALLLMASGAALAGRRRGRGLALQAVAANAALAALAFALLAPVRDDVAHAVAEHAVDDGQAQKPQAPRQQSYSMFKEEALQEERKRSGLEIVVYGLALIALTRRRTKAYFEALEAALADAEPQ